MMSKLESLVQDLVIANRILASENVVDAYGHVSVRHPDDPKTFLISCLRSPALVEKEDIVTLDLEGRCANEGNRPLYIERFIHAAIYQARPDVMAVVHAHAEDILPFSIVKSVKLQPVIHAAACIGHEIPIWDIAEKFGDTNLLVNDMAKAHELATTFGKNNVTLMRGHGFTSVASSIMEAVRVAVYLPVNARTLMRALQLGGPITYMSLNEIDACGGFRAARPWDYWATKAGCGHMLAGPTIR